MPCVRCVVGFSGQALGPALPAVPVLPAVPTLPAVPAPPTLSAPPPRTLAPAIPAVPPQVFPEAQEAPDDRLQSAIASLQRLAARSS